MLQLFADKIGRTRHGGENRNKLPNTEKAKPLRAVELISHGSGMGGAEKAPYRGPRPDVTLLTRPSWLVRWRQDR